MSTLSKVLAVIFLAMLVVLVGTIVTHIREAYRYDREIGSYWSLADKASTITQKSEYVDKFVAALESQHLDGEYNALLFATPDNSFDKNIEALRSLQWRLREIQTMNPASFEYQTAIQQITAQEQGEASVMLSDLGGCWWKRNHILLWDWIAFVNYFVQCSILIWLGWAVLRYAED